MANQHERSVILMVADEKSLFQIANRLQSTLAIVAISQGRTDSPRWLSQLWESCPRFRIPALSANAGIAEGPDSAAAV